MLFRPGVEADHFNRFKLGRSLDKVFGYGCDACYSVKSVWMFAGKKLLIFGFTASIRPRFSLTGAYVPDSDESAIRIVRGYSKDHRPDLKGKWFWRPLISQNGGIPLVCKSWTMAMRRIPRFP